MFNKFPKYHNNYFILRNEQKNTSLPIIERQCKHKSPKIIRREYFEGFLITAVDLCKDCLVDPLFSEKADFVDKKVKPKKKLNTKTALKKSIIQRKIELEQLEKRKDEVLHIDDSLKQIPKLVEYYICFATLSKELNRLYDLYVKLLEKQYC